MHRGRRVEPERDCDFCGKPLPTIRHPKTKFCNPTCRQRYRWAQLNKGKGIKCLICGNFYARVGSHVVQVHGYDSVAQYRKEFGLMARETRIDTHAAEMRSKAVTADNLERGAPYRYVKGGDHGERVKEFWRNRERKLGTRARNIPGSIEKLE